MALLVSHRIGGARWWRVLVGLGVLLAGLSAAASAQATVTIQGQWQCQDRGVSMPLRGAKVELHTTGIFGGTVATGFTDSDGQYSLSTHDGGDHFVRLVLRDDQGVHLNDSIVPWDWYSDSRTFNLGVGLNLVGADTLSDGAGNTPVCAVWQGFHDAFADFQSATGSPPPYGHDLLIRGNAWPTAGVPFTLMTTVNWPSGFETGPAPGDFTVARHEFGHTFRHAFDGDLPHFLHDVLVFDYTQQHSECLTTNPGFAFNEGWAEFWSGDTSACHPSDPEGNQSTEGDVAASLLRLQEHCNDSRADMVRVLQLFRGQIHSFDEYRARINRCVPTSVTPTPVPSTDGSVVPQSAQAAVRAHLHITGGIHSLLGGLTGNVAPDSAAVRRLRPCSGINCDVQLGVRILPPLLQARIAGLRLEARLLAQYANRNATQRFYRLSETKQINAMNAPIRTFATGIKRISRQGLQHAMAAIRPLLRTDHSSVARGLLNRLRGALSLIGRSGATEDFLSLGPPAGSVVRSARIRHFQPPKPWLGVFTPLPPPPPPVSTTLTLSCPGKATVNTALQVSGLLSPGVAGETISVTYTHQTQGPLESFTHTVTSSATGAFSDSIVPNDPGNWQAQASFGGDATHQASTSAACQNTVEP